MRRQPTCRKHLRMNLGILDSVAHQHKGTDSLQSFVLPANDRARAVHNPCSLTGDGTRGLQPSGCATKRESTPEAGRYRGRDEDRELLRPIANSKVFTEFGRAFTHATGLPVALRPVESLQLSFHDRSNQAPFCALMARENRTCGACLQSQSQVAQDAVERPQTSVCYAGLYETVVPLRLG